MILLKVRLVDMDVVGLTTGNVIYFLKTSKKIWEENCVVK